MCVSVCERERERFFGTNKTQISVISALEGKSTLTSVKQLRVTVNECVRNVAVFCVTLSCLLLPFIVMIITTAPFSPPFFHLPHCPCLFQGTQLIFNAAKELGQLSKLKVQHHVALGLASLHPGGRVIDLWFLFWPPGAHGS